MVIDSGIASNPGIVCCYCRFSFFGRQLHNAAPTQSPFFTSEGRVVNERGWRISGACHAIRVLRGNREDCSLHYRYIIQRAVRLEKKRSNREQHRYVRTNLSCGLMTNYLAHFRIT